jgi:acyl-CoA synthetase (NDP forming)
MVMGSDNQPKMMDDIFKILMADDKFGSLLFVQIVHDARQSAEVGLFLNKLVSEYPDKPIVAALVGPNGFECVKELQLAGRILAYHSPERAARALARRFHCSQVRPGA